ncbi:hypothetical protein [Xenorhabdus szentirmaii]|uniref:hypothetical protein n=1 Tax=Xenorhabdus szentirmaii TaxID=290112 RepID=UPI0019B73626|nr:hypothetical protein [Xenorhabdus sp. 5]MBD2826148.1 hypothetical protein [Xenorhabdus sp. 5]
MNPEQRDMPMHDLHLLFITRIVHNLCKGILSPEEAEREAKGICALGSIRLAAKALNNLETRLRRLCE